MPFILAPFVTKKMQGLWTEGAPYSSELIYDGCAPAPENPPVHYEAHTLKPHSICHFDAPKHIIPGGKTIDSLIQESSSFFYGPALVLKFKNPKFKPHPLRPAFSHWEISREELENALCPFTVGTLSKILMSFDGDGPDFFSDQARGFTLSLEAAAHLTSLPEFNLLGTSWRSADFQPDSRERPIHRELFKKAAILECLDLSKVPEGRYFLSAFPIPLEGASESPVCPVLFSEGEVDFRQ